ncbi:MAG: hypothetical protein KDB22_03600 [Planctomycetales bacterium]|nr:hypothetical protein [Planctomycetales bacterium]
MKSIQPMLRPSGIPKQESQGLSNFLSPCCTVRGLLAVLILAVCPALPSRLAFAQYPVAPTQRLGNVHYLLDSNDPPGYVASAQIARGARGVGSFQPVSIMGPAGLQISLAAEGQFLHSLEAPVTTAMLVGSVYRVRVTNIPFQPGQELYPTIEVIDRVYAPAGREHRYPIPVTLTDEDLRLASQGALVTRVIYLEDGEVADPIAVEPGQQLEHNVNALDNALQVADQLGRPVAILRIGSRVPADLTADLTGFLYGCPPWLPLSPVPTREALVRDGMWPEMAPVVAAEQLFSQPPLEESPRVEMAR